MIQDQTVNLHKNLATKLNQFLVIKLDPIQQPTNKDFLI